MENLSLDKILKLDLSKCGDVNFGLVYPFKRTGANGEWDTVEQTTIKEVHAAFKKCFPELTDDLVQFVASPGGTGVIRYFDLGNNIRFAVYINLGQSITNDCVRGSYSFPIYGYSYITIDIQGENIDIGAIIQHIEGEGGIIYNKDNLTPEIVWIEHSNSPDCPLNNPGDDGGSGDDGGGGDDDSDKCVNYINLCDVGQAIFSRLVHGTGTVSVKTKKCDELNPQDLSCGSCYECKKSGG